MTEEAVLARRKVGFACFEVLPGAEHTPEEFGGSLGGWGCTSGTQSRIPLFLRAASPRNTRSGFQTIWISTP